MLKSKFKFQIILIPVLIISLTSTSIYIIAENWPIKSNQIKLIHIFIAVSIVNLWLWLVFGELRTKIINVIVDYDYIEKKNYFGCSYKYNFKDFDGFKISILPSRDGSYEYLYLVKADKKIIKISEFYHKNYHELKNKISENLEDLGEIKFSYIQEFKEIFK